MDPSIFTLKMESLREHYRDAHREIHVDIPEPLGCDFTIIVYVYTSHTVNNVILQSNWFSKHKNTVEFNTLSS